MVLEPGEQDLGGAADLDQCHFDGVEDEKVAAWCCEDGGTTAGAYGHGAELLRGLGKALVPAQCAGPVVFNLDGGDERFRWVAFGVGLAGLVGHAEGGVALWSVVDLAAHIAALVGVGVGGCVGCGDGKGDGCEGEGGACERGGRASVHGGLQDG